MIEFRLGLAAHHILPGKDVVEVLLDGRVVGTIVSLGANGVRVISAHFGETEHRENVGEPVPVPEVRMTFDPRPYRIEKGRIVRDSA